MDLFMDLCKFELALFLMLWLLPLGWPAASLLEMSP